jgi:hypothetical protein
MSENAFTIAENLAVNEVVKAVDTLVWGCVRLYANSEDWDAAAAALICLVKERMNA